jgi:hypothetical protein
MFGRNIFFERIKSEVSIDLKWRNAGTPAWVHFKNCKVAAFC